MSDTEARPGKGHTTQRRNVSERIRTPNGIIYVQDSPAGPAARIERPGEYVEYGTPAAETLARLRRLPDVQ